MVAATCRVFTVASALFARARAGISLPVLLGAWQPPRRRARLGPLQADARVGPGCAHPRRARDARSRGAGRRVRAAQDLVRDGPRARRGRVRGLSSGSRIRSLTLCSSAAISPTLSSSRSPCRSTSSSSVSCGSARQWSYIASAIATALSTGRSVEAGTTSARPWFRRTARSHTLASSSSIERKRW